MMTRGEETDPVKPAVFIRENFGAAITYGSYYFRSFLPGIAPNRQWVVFENFPRGRRVAGVLIGLRYLRNGKIDIYNDTWLPMGDPIPAYLVVTDPYRNPLYIPINDLVLAPGAASKGRAAQP
jgi:hypothetical protein